MRSHNLPAVCLALPLLFASFGCQGSRPAPEQAAAPATPRYVFLFIGDGMGFPAVELAEHAARRRGDSLLMNRLPVRGQIHTRSADAEVTDSAAAATALASGVKTNNKMIGQTPDGRPLPSLADAFLDAGADVGLVTSVGADHATPAAFYAHQPSRNEYEAIARQFPGSGVDLLAGRGLNTSDDVREAIVTAWEAEGVAVATSLDAAAATPADARLVLLAESLGETAGGPGELADGVDLAIDRLAPRNPRNDPADAEGFFLMVEGGAIDWAGHGNRGWQSVDETLAFDRALREAYDFYREHPRETLIVVTADHETGGLSVDPARLDFDALRAVPARVEALSDNLAEDAEALTPEAVYEAVARWMGLDDLTDAERSQLARMTEHGPERRRRLVILEASRIAQARAGVGWTTGSHTADDVPVFAVGVGAERFAGTYDNTELHERLLEATGLEQPSAVEAGR